MEQNKTNSVITFWELLRLFGKKIKSIILIGVIAAIVGGTLVGVMTAKSKTYDAELMIAVSSADEYDTLIYHLSAGFFAESILLDENGLPAKEKCNPEDYEKALVALEKYKDSRKAAQEKNDAVNTYYISDIESKYAALQNEYNQIFDLLKVYKGTQTEGTIDDAHKAMISVYEQKLLAADKARNDYYNEYYSKAIAKKKTLEIEFLKAKDELGENRKLANEALEKVIASLRADAEVKADVLKALNYVSYEYVDPFDVKDTKKSEAKFDINKKYIKIDISVPGDEAFAEKLLACYKMHICDYAEKRLDAEMDSVKSSCVIANPTASVSVNSANIMGEIVKSAAVCGVAGVAVTYLFFVVRLLAQINAKKEDETDGGTDKA